MTRLVSTFISVSCVFSALSAVLTPEQALQRVMDTDATKSIIRHAAKEKYRLIATRETAGQSAVYVFAGVKNQGFLILSADDQTVPVLGYGDNCSSSTHALPPQLSWWLNEYAQEIGWFRAEMPGTVTTADYPESHENSFKAAASRQEIPPMITSQWNQSSPFNRDCPRSGNLTTLTGCEATAMAQVVRYHHLPITKNAGQATVTFNGTVYSYDFNKASFDWDNMIDKYSNGNYTDAQASAVANLMYACGVSIDTRYGTGESLAYDGTPAVALPKYFGFNNACVCKLRKTYSLDTWIDMIYRQLTDYGPVIYAGQSSQGGHAFVCDGYSTDDYFHINWGWGGFCDGYFKLSALDPYMSLISSGAYNYNSDQSAIVNICSPEKVITFTHSMALTEPLAPVSNDTTTPENYKEIKSIPANQTFKLAGYPVNTGNTELSGMVGYKLISEKNPNSTFNRSLEFFNNLPMDHGFRYLSINLSSQSPGKYRLIPIWMPFSGNSEWQEYDIPVNNPHYIDLLISDGTIYFTVPEHKLTAELISVDTPVFSGVECQLSVKVSNASAGEYAGNIYAVLSDADLNKVIAQGEEMAFDIVPDNSEETKYITTFTPVSRAIVEKGNYKLSFVDDQGRSISGFYDLAVAETPVIMGSPELETFSLDGNKDAIYRNKLNFTANIVNNVGYFVGRVEVGIHDENQELTLAKFRSNTLYLDEEQSYVANINGSLPELVPGTKYAAVPYIVRSDGTITRTGEPIMFVATDYDAPTSVNLISGNKNVISREIYTLQGTRVYTARPLDGIYIVLEHHSDGTVTVTRQILGVN